LNHTYPIFLLGSIRRAFEDLAQSYPSRPVRRPSQQAAPFYTDKESWNVALNQLQSKILPLASQQVKIVAKLVDCRLQDNQGLKHKLIARIWWGFDQCLNKLVLFHYKHL
jgi:hypothetical protein